MDERIHGAFSYVRFKLFDLQINGALAECCETTVGGRPYRNLSTAERINAGIEISRVLSRHYGIDLPSFMDHCESVLEIMPSEHQQIKLVVSADHPALTLQLED